MLLIEQRLSEQVLQENISLVSDSKYHCLACHFFVVKCEFYYQYLSEQLFFSVYAKT